MKVLLDTHTLIWAGVDENQLSRSAKSLIADARTTLCVSAASAWEIATKVRSGKLPEAVALERDFVAILQREGYELLPVEVKTALRAGRLLGVHRDPWDRMIAAQALEMDIPIISIDSKLDEFGVRRIW
jgi:PIN domain nuclease of toxin-antitoxin system